MRGSLLLHYFRTLEALNSSFCILRRLRYPFFQHLPVFRANGCDPEVIRCLFLLPVKVNDLGVNIIKAVRIHAEIEYQFDIGERFEGRVNGCTNKIFLQHRRFSPHGLTGDFLFSTFQQWKGRLISTPFSLSVRGVN